LFRAYERHCLDPDLDTLFATLNALHSLNDRLKNAIDDDLHKFREFVALKALRNLTHHSEEVHSNVRVVPAPGLSDLMFLCIVRRDQVEHAIANTGERWRDVTQLACETVFHWYGQAVNINPCIFNVMVHVYEMLENVELMSDDEASDVFRQIYLSETEDGRSHFVDGKVSGRAGDIDRVLSAMVENLPKP
jgi:hypothetical protein